MHIRSAAKTHVGLIRTNNEDSFLCDDVAGLYAVADGMGGHAAGEVASKIAVEKLANCARLSAPAPVDLRAALSHINRAILIEAHGERDGMGTTLSALLIREGFPAYVAHVGDSRCYLVRDGIGKQLTHDHVAPGHKHVILNCLGGVPGSHIKTDIITEQVRPGDVFVLCSDGLSDYVDAEELARLLRIRREFSGDSPEEELSGFAETLLRRALQSGGKDNITVVVVAVETDS